jgi:hypothetical protein
VREVVRWGRGGVEGTYRVEVVSEKGKMAGRRTGGCGGVKED